MENVKKVSKSNTKDKKYKSYIIKVTIIGQVIIYILLKLEIY